MTAKKWAKKCHTRAEFTVVLRIKLIAFLTFSLPSPKLDLKFPSKSGKVTSFGKELDRGTEGYALDSRWSTKYLPLKFPACN